MKTKVRRIILVALALALAFALGVPMVAYADGGAYGTVWVNSAGGGTAGCSPSSWGSGWFYGEWEDWWNWTGSTCSSGFWPAQATAAAVSWAGGSGPDSYAWTYSDADAWGSGMAGAYGGLYDFWRVYYVPGALANDGATADTDVYATAGYYYGSGWATAYGFSEAAGYGSLANLYSNAYADGSWGMANSYAGYYDWWSGTRYPGALATGGAEADTNVSAYAGYLYGGGYAEGYGFSEAHDPNSLADLYSYAYADGTWSRAYSYGGYYDGWRGTLYPGALATGGATANTDVYAYGGYYYGSGWGTAYGFSEAHGANSLADVYSYAMGEGPWSSAYAYGGYYDSWRGTFYPGAYADGGATADTDVYAYAGYWWGSGFNYAEGYGFAEAYDSNSSADVYSAAYADGPGSQAYAYGGLYDWWNGYYIPGAYADGGATADTDVYAYAGYWYDVYSYAEGYGFSEAYGTDSSATAYGDAWADYYSTAKAYAGYYDWTGMGYIPGALADDNSTAVGSAIADATFYSWAEVYGIGHAINNSEAYGYGYGNAYMDGTTVLGAQAYAVDDSYAYADATGYASWGSLVGGVPWPMGDGAYAEAINCSTAYATFYGYADVGSGAVGGAEAYAYDYSHAASCSDVIAMYGSMAEGLTVAAADPFSYAMAISDVTAFNGSQAGGIVVAEAMEPGNDTSGFAASISWDKSANAVVYSVAIGYTPGNGSGLALGYVYASADNMSSATGVASASTDGLAFLSGGDLSYVLNDASAFTDALAP